MSNSGGGLFISKRAFKVPLYFSADLSDKRAPGGDVLKVEWLEGLRYDFLPPNIMQL